MSLDGRLAPPEGGPAQLGGRGDRRALEEALAWADGCLIGAETLRQHGTTCLIRDDDLLAARRHDDRIPQPIAIAVSRSGCIPASLPFFGQPLQRWLLRACAADGVTPAEPPCGFHRWGDLPSWTEALAWLTDLGIDRIVVLGGATLASSLLLEGLVDELQLTVVPRLLGGTHLWLPAFTGVAGAVDGGAWRLVEHRPLGGEEILVRYRRAGGSAQGPAWALPAP